MTNTSDYRLQADECRALARTIECPDQRDLLLEMAATWEALGQGRARRAGGMLRSGGRASSV
jgi:hypothetical protein